MHGKEEKEWAAEGANMGIMATDEELLMPQLTGNPGGKVARISGKDPIQGYKGGLPFG